jgi:hypothetical protein
MYGGSKVMEILKGVAGKTKSPVAEEIVKSNDFADACCAARQLLDEAIEELADGEMTWKELVEDLSKNLKAIEMPKPPEKDKAVKEK